MEYGGLSIIAASVHLFCLSHHYKCKAGFGIRQVQGIRWNGERKSDLALTFQINW